MAFACPKVTRGSSIIKDLLLGPPSDSRGPREKRKHDAPLLAKRVGKFEGSETILENYDWSYLLRPPGLRSYWEL